LSSPTRRRWKKIANTWTELPTPQEGGQDLRGDLDGGARDGHDRQRAQEREDHDHQRQHHGTGPPEQQEQEGRDGDDGDQGEADHVGLNRSLQGLDQDRRPPQIDPEVGCLVASDDGLDRVHDLRVLGAREEGAIGGRGTALVAEAPELVVVQAERRVGVGLDADGRDAAVPGQQEVPVQGIPESELPDARELFRRARPIREQVSDDELVPLAAGVSGVDEARHVLELGDLVLDLLVQVAQLCEEREVEDLRWLDGDEDAVVSPELLAKGVVGDADGVVLVQEALGRGVELDLRELRDQRAGDEQDGDDREPRTVVGPLAPAREGVLDPLPDRCRRTAARAHLVQPPTLPPPVRREA
jgi:hypothetical protein